VFLFSLWHHLGSHLYCQCRASRLRYYCSESQLHCFLFLFTYDWMSSVLTHMLIRFASLWNLHRENHMWAIFNNKRGPVLQSQSQTRALQIQICLQIQDYCNLYKVHIHVPCYHILTITEFTCLKNQALTTQYIPWDLNLMPFHLLPKLFIDTYELKL
jgi:hypothetical protein